MLRSHRARFSGVHMTAVLPTPAAAARAAARARAKLLTADIRATRRSPRSGPWRIFPPMRCRPQARPLQQTGSRRPWKNRGPITASLGPDLRRRRGPAPGAAGVPRDLQRDMADRAPRLQVARCRPTGPAFNRGTRRVGSSSVSHHPRAVHCRGMWGRRPALAFPASRASSRGGRAASRPTLFQAGLQPDPCITVCILKMLSLCRKNLQPASELGIG